MEYMPYIWLAVIVAAAVAEAITTSLVSVWFIPAGIASALLAVFDVDIVWQLLAFFLISTVCLVLSRTIFRDMLRKKDTRTDLDTIIGAKCVVTEKIDNIIGLGQVKIRGLYWAARSCDGSNYDVGEVLTVVAIEGVKVICKK